MNKNTFSKVIIDLQYLPPISYFCCLMSYDEVIIDLHENYQKQSYRNRAHILSSNKLLTLSIPVHKEGTQNSTGDVHIDYRQKWVQKHWRAITSCYGKAAFFKHYAPYFEEVFKAKPTKLSDFNLKLLTLCIRLLKINISIQLSEKKISNHKTLNINDLRGEIHPKKDIKKLNIYKPVSYWQNFSNTFIANLSIIDLLMNEGNHALSVIEKSKGQKE